MLKIIEFEKYNKNSDTPEIDEIEVDPETNYQALCNLVQDCLKIDPNYWAYRILP